MIYQVRTAEGVPAGQPTTDIATAESLATWYHGGSVVSGRCFRVRGLVCFPGARDVVVAEFEDVVAVGGRTSEPREGDAPYVEREVTGAEVATSRRRSARSVHIARPSFD